MKIEFDSTVGDDIPVVVVGYYEAADNPAGYCGSFDVQSIYVKSDIKREHDIESLISMANGWRRLESEGMRAGEKFIEGRGK